MTESCALIEMGTISAKYRTTGIKRNFMKKLELLVIDQLDRTDQFIVC